MKTDLDCMLCFKPINENQPKTSLKSFDGTFHEDWFHIKCTMGNCRICEQGFTDNDYSYKDTKIKRILDTYTNDDEEEVTIQYFVHVVCYKNKDQALKQK